LPVNCAQANGTWSWGHYLTHVQAYGQTKGWKTLKHFQNNFLILANDLYLLFLFVLFQNDTMRVLYAYHSEDPAARPDSKLATVLYHGPTQRGFRSLYLMERVNLEEPPPRDLLIWDLKNPMVIYVSYVAWVMSELV